MYAADVGASLAFYRDALELVPGYRWPADGDPDFVVLSAGEGTIGIAAAAAPRELLGIDVGGEPRFELCFYVDDVDDTLDRLRGRSVRVLRAAEEMPWGERMAYVADPDGNPIQITASGGASA